ncbi:MAG TPA: FtsX-like permease family protein, partial [Microthrixaceae bacterium]|nr:FtsX-like permease family protein [Microthrixaceae bacterium]
MLKLSIRTLLANKGRFLMTTFAVVLGVAFVVGSFVVTDTVRVAFDGLFTEIQGGSDVTVRAQSDLDSGGGGPAARGRIPDTLVEVVEGVDGVASAQGSVTGYAQILDQQGEPATTSGAPLLGISWGEEDGALTLDDGRKPQGPNEVAIDRGTADEYDLDPGVQTQVLLVSGPRPVEVVGVFTFGETNSLLGARLTAFGMPAAQEALGSVGQLDTIEVRADSGIEPSELADRLQLMLPDGVESVTDTQVVEENVDQLGQFVGIFQTVLLAFAGVALFVSAFYINNTFSIVLGQRVRQLALLRALGASTTQVRRSVTVEALIVGVLASVLGIAAGLGVAVLLQSILSAGGFELPATGLELQLRTWIAALVIGIGVTVLASIAPGRRAAKVTPVEGMREGVLHHSGGSGRRLILGGALTAIGAVAMLVALFAVDDTAALFGLLAIGAIAVFLGVAWLSPVFAVPAGRILGWPMEKLFKVPGRLARENTMRNPHRTARTASALMIGLALVAMVLVVGESIKQSASAAIEGAVSADFVISTDNFTGFSPTVATDVAALPEVSAASGARFDRFEFDGTAEDLTAVDVSVIDQLMDVDMIDGSFDEADESSIWVHEDSAEENGVSVGDTVPVKFASGGEQDFTVAGVYGDATLAGNFLVSLDTFTEFYPSVPVDFFAFAKAADDVPVDDARTAIEGVLDAYPQVTLEDRSEFQQSQEDQLNGILASVNGLLGLAIVIALLGIANTLALSVLERTREIGLLRAVGMLRKQSRRMVLAEAVIVAVFGAVLGLVIGLLFGLGASTAMPDSAVSTVAVPWGGLVTIVIVAAIA